MEFNSELLINDRLQNNYLTTYKPLTPPKYESSNAFKKLRDALLYQTLNMPDLTPLLASLSSKKEEPQIEQDDEEPIQPLSKAIFEDISDLYSLNDKQSDLDDTNYSANFLLSFRDNWLGVDYKYGGNSKSGIDCSGLTLQFAKGLGIKIPRTSQDLYNSAEKINPLDARKGDFIFMGDSSSAIKHVGIFYGWKRKDNKNYAVLLEAPHTGDKVKIIEFDYDSGMFGKHKIIGFGRYNSIQERLQQALSTASTLTKSPSSTLTRLTGDKELFAQVIKPLFKEALQRKGYSLSNLDNMVRLAAFESGYGEKGIGIYNLGGITWNENFKGKYEPITANGKQYIKFNSYEEYVDFATDLLHNVYKADEATSTLDFCERLHGKNPSKKSYSSKKDKYIYTLLNMTTLDKYLKEVK